MVKSAVLAARRIPFEETPRLKKLKILLLVMLLLLLSTPADNTREYMAQTGRLASVAQVMSL